MHVRVFAGLFRRENAPVDGFLYPGMVNRQLLDATAALAKAIVAGAPGVRILATSQEPLHLPEEQQYRTAALAVPAEIPLERARTFGAVALFEARVRAADPAFSLNEENVALAIDEARDVWTIRLIDSLSLDVRLMWLLSGRGLIAALRSALGPRRQGLEDEGRWRALLRGQARRLRLLLRGGLRVRAPR